MLTVERGTADSGLFGVDEEPSPTSSSYAFNLVFAIRNSGLKHVIADYDKVGCRLGLLSARRNCKGEVGFKTEILVRAAISDDVKRTKL
jgi:hypothetical protein